MPFQGGARIRADIACCLIALAAGLTGCGGGGGGSTGSGGSGITTPPPQPPSAQIASILPATLLAGDELTLTALNPSPSLSYEWTFGDGKSASGSKVQHRFAAPGSYSIELTVTDAQRLSSKTSATVVVAAVSLAAKVESVSNAKPRLNESILVKGSGSGQAPLTYEWLVDDKPVTASANTTQLDHTFTSPGSHSVTFKVTDATGKMVSASVSVSVAALAPVALIAKHPESALVANAAQFEAAMAAGSQEFGWDFGDGSSVIRGPKASHAYAVPGVYSITLTAWNADGEKATATASVTVTHPPPSLRIEASEDYAALLPIGRTLDFVAQAQGAEPLSYRWTFGNDTEATGAWVRRAFPKAGAHEVSVEVSDRYGGKASAKLNLTVGPIQFKALPGSDPAPRLAAGKGSQALQSVQGIACMPDESVLTRDAGAVMRIDGSHQVSTFAGRPILSTNQPTGGSLDQVRFNGYVMGITRDGAGNIYVSDSTYLVWKLDLSGQASVVPGISTRLDLAAVDNSGRIYYGLGSAVPAPGVIRRFDPASKTTEIIAGSDTERGHVDGPALNARFQSIASMAFGPDNALYIGERDGTAPRGRIRRLASDGTVTTVAELPRDSNGWPVSIAVTAQGTVHALTLDGNLHTIRNGNVSSISLGSVSTGSRLSACGSDSRPSSKVAIAITGATLMLDSTTGVINKMLGDFSDFSPPGWPDRHFLVGTDPADNGLVKNKFAIAQLDAIGRRVGWAGSPFLSGYIDDGRDNARFGSITSAKAMPDGTMWVFDGVNRAIRKIDPLGNVSTAHGPFSTDYKSMAASRSGELFLISDKAIVRIGKDSSSSSRFLPSDGPINFAVVNSKGELVYIRECAIYKLGMEGPETLLAGQRWPSFGNQSCHADRSTDGAGAAASFQHLSNYGIAIDDADNLFVADGNLLRIVDSQGRVTTLASFFSLLPDETGAEVVDYPFSAIALHVTRDGELLIQSSGTGQVVRSIGVAGRKP